MLKYFLKDTKSYKQHDLTYDENLSIYVQNYIIMGEKSMKKYLIFLSGILWTVKLQIIIFFFIFRPFLKYLNKLSLYLQSETKK